MPQTLFDKIWAGHEIPGPADGPGLLYVDRHLVHEVSSPQAFEALRLQGRSVRRPDLTLAIADHNVSTAPDRLGLADADPESREQIAALEANARASDITFLGLDHPDQGIVHVVGPELGFSLPGSVIVCGDSHTTAHGAFGALACGIGTTDIEHVLATQTLALRRPRTMRIHLDGVLEPGVGAKDVILRVIGAIGASGAVGHVIEFAGPVVEAMSMEARMTLANMSVEAGARASLIAPDETTLAYLKGRPMAPQGDDWGRAVAAWRQLKSDPGARFDAEHRLDLGHLAPQVTWGLSPEEVVSIDGRVPDPASFEGAAAQAQAADTLSYMDLAPGQPMQDVAIDHVFIGSCTNSRIEDLRSAASILNGRRVAEGVKRALVVPGSGRVKRQAEAEGLDVIFRQAGFEWREPGCSACIGMNPDRLPSGARCASTSNRNFRNRQGDGVRTHLVSPLMAAAAAITGRLADARQFL